MQTSQKSSAETTSQATTDSTDGGNDAAMLDAFRAALEAEETGGGQEGEQLDGDDTSESDTADSSKKDGKPKGKPKTLKDVAERLGVADADLYGIKVSLGGADGQSEGDTLTLGELKDLAAKNRDMEMRELQFSERKSKQEAELTRARAELEELSKLAPAKPEDREKAKQIVATRHAAERKLIMQTIPEWADETVREAELGAMVEYLRDFGLSEAFLAGDVNHRVFRLVRAATLQKQRVERALAKVEKIKKKPAPAQKGPAATGAAKKPGSSSGNNARSALNSDGVRAQFEQALREAG